MVVKGGRELEKVEFNGSVHQKDSVSAPIGIIKEHWPDPVIECRIPVGDYTPYYMKVTYDNLAITISNNYHTNARGRSAGKEIIYGSRCVKISRTYWIYRTNQWWFSTSRPQIKSLFRVETKSNSPLY